ncbi:MAG: hypothetical protein PVI81_07290 [Anaerolineales bacterium]|jgi:hypothetical protein
MTADSETVRYVVFHTLFPIWEKGVDFREQVSIDKHIYHYCTLFKEGKLELGSSFLLPDLGSMMIAVQGYPMEELIAFAAEDPAVQSGLLEYAVRPWYTPMDRRSK